MKKLKISKLGFTLIELLIVIALLGALAVGLLASMDPFEQLKKGNDTSTRGAAEEFYNSLIRYYAQRSMFPVNMPATGVVTTINALPAVVSELANAGELKADFINLAGTAKLGRIHFIRPNSESIVACFNPESKAFRNDKNALYNRTGLTQATSMCPNGTQTGCFVCFK